MVLKEQNVLFFTRTMGLGGTENVVIQLCEIFQPLVNHLVVCSCGGVNVEKLDKMGIKHYLIQDIERKSPETMLHISKSIKDIISQEHITVIHTHHRMAAFYVRILHLYKQCFCVNTSHNTFYNKKILTRFAYGKSHLIACGEMVKKNLEDYFGLDNISVIHNAVKAFAEAVRTDSELQNKKEKGFFLIGNIGRLSEQKGMEYYIQAIPAILKKHSNTFFYIAGAGEDEERLKAIAKDLPIHFLGYRSDIQNLMTQLDLIVLSSLWEGFPLTPIEAFSVGKTIVATNVDGTKEIVKDKENGLLVVPGNAEDLAEKICWMIENPDEVKKMECNAKKSFEKDFSFEVFKDSYVEFYKNL